jgi:hypothetical protein
MLENEDEGKAEQEAKVASRSSASLKHAKSLYHKRKLVKDADGDEWISLHDHLHFNTPVIHEEFMCVVKEHLQRFS